jgi:hypothetical protein
VTALVQEVVPDASDQEPSFTFTWTLSTALLSEAVPVNVMEDAVTFAPLEGDSMLIVGSVVSGADAVVDPVAEPPRLQSAFADSESPSFAPISYV